MQRLLTFVCTKDFLACCIEGVQEVGFQDLSGLAAHVTLKDPLSFILLYSVCVERSPLSVELVNLGQHHILEVRFLSKRG